MGILDEIIGAVTGGPQNTPSEHSIPAILTGLLVNHEGGLASVFEKARELGLDDTVKSWIGNGANLPISKDMIQQLLGSDLIQQLAARTGIPLDQLAQQLSAHLPQVVDGLTPGGAEPAPGSNELTDAAAAFLKNRFNVG